MAKRNQVEVKYNRGDELNGGKVVGYSKGGILWVSYEGPADYSKMCETFDRTQK